MQVPQLGTKQNQDKKQYLEEACNQQHQEQHRTNKQEEYTYSSATHTRLQ